MLWKSLDGIHRIPSPLQTMFMNGIYRLETIEIMD